jgi:hypothetical protein
LAGLQVPSSLARHLDVGDDEGALDVGDVGEGQHLRLEALAHVGPLGDGALGRVVEQRDARLVALSDRGLGLRELEQHLHMDGVCAQCA